VLAENGECEARIEVGFGDRGGVKAEVDQAKVSDHGTERTYANLEGEGVARHGEFDGHVNACHDSTRRWLYAATTGGL
jgi:hypothetical protein